MGFDKEIKLGDTFLELPKSKFQVHHADNIGHFPFYTSGDSILSHSEFNVDDDIIFLATGGKANVKFHSGKAAYSTDTYAIKGKNHSSKYLHYLLLNNLSYIDRNFFCGSGLKHLQKKDFKNWLLSFPDDTSEEEKIIQFLSTLDRTIATTEQLIAKYQHIKTGLLHDLLTRGIDEHGNLRSEKTHQFKDSKLGRIPMEWEVANINSVSNNKSGCIKTGPFGSSLKISDWVQNGEVPVVTIGSIDEDDFIEKELLFVSVEKAKQLSVYKLEIDDILFSRVADVGRAIVIKSKHKGWLMSSNFMRLRLDKELMRPIYLKLNFQFSHQITKQKNAFLNSSGRLVTNTTIMKSFYFPKPDIKEQDKIINIFEKLKRTEHNYNNKLTKLQSLKSGLMQDLLSGRVRVNI